MPYVLDDSELDRPAQYVLRKVKLERGSKAVRRITKPGTLKGQDSVIVSKYRFVKAPKSRVK